MDVHEDAYVSRSVYRSGARIFSRENSRRESSEYFEPVISSESLFNPIFLFLLVPSRDFISERSFESLSFLHQSDL